MTNLLNHELPSFQFELAALKHLRRNETFWDLAGKRTSQKFFTNCGAICSCIAFTTLAVAIALAFGK